jgi:prephenate dehydrogenase
MLSRGLASRVTGIDPSPEVLEKALQLGAASDGAVSLEKGVAGAELVLLATPAQAALELLPQLVPLLPVGVIVSDVCSTKQMIVAQARAVLPEKVSFVGGHPMAGSDKGGVGALDEFLFENALYVLTPDDKTDMAAVTAIKKLVSGLGALPVVMSPERHDFLAGVISHLPHMAASALAAAAAKKDEVREELLALAAGGFRDTTRVAMSNPKMWRDICLTNGANITSLLEEYIAELTSLKDAITAGDGGELLSRFQAAREFRLQVPARGKGIMPSIFNLFVFIQDRPGIIGEVTGKLGAGGVNIAEIELLRVREDVGGPIRLGFLSAETRDSAYNLLSRAGYRVEMREGE